MGKERSLNKVNVLMRGHVFLPYIRNRNKEDNVNTAIIKQWFNEYVESGDGKDWRKSYENTFNNVQEIKQKLNNGYKLSAQNDFEFLSELLKNDANGVASKGQSNLANDVFDKIIQDTEFLNVVEKLIQQPNEETYKALHSYGSQLLDQLGSTKRPLLFNRACASCTLDVSTLVDQNKFHQFVEYVTIQQIIDFPQEIREKNWYVKNIYVVQQVREILEAELEAGQTDIFWLNMFLWDVYAKKVATNFYAKNAIDYLNDRYPNTYTSTKHIAAFKTPQGRELALDPKAKTPVIFCDAEPPVELKIPIKKIYLEDDTRNHHLSTHAKSLMLGNKAYSIIVGTLDDLEKLCEWYEQSADQTTVLEQKKQHTKELMDEVMTQQPLNRILFGAAGTGKTYNTINHALAILENKELVEIANQENQPDGRKKLKDQFDKLKSEGRIKFVTFHQSFSYEDFVEGIRAETDDNGQLSYDVKAGVFKEICDTAKLNSNRIILDADNSFKNSINEAIERLIQKVQKAEITFYTKRSIEFKVYGNENGAIYAITSGVQRVSLSKKHIYEYLENPSDEILDQKSYEWAIAYTLRSEIKYEGIQRKKKSYILIIDEINRGNISRIFGELITLIEDSKRQGAEEELSVTLPYSKEEFAVPSNVYIIGTMNSSDRSLTGLDIALRRRFTFIEMPPQPKEIKHEDGELIKISGKDKNGNDQQVIVADLLSVMNQRIEVLLDRDHCIGHANFMSLRKTPTLEHLAVIFKQKIIPQLQEYFFDDWSKINLVFFNNKMIIEDQEINISGLFPPNTGEDIHYSEQKKIWKINEEAFKTIDAFVSILGAKG